MSQIIVLAVVLALATALGTYHRSRSGRMVPAAATASDRQRLPEGTPQARPTTSETNDLFAAVGNRTGDRATLVQFSSAFCQPCRATRLLLSDVAAVVPGVSHVEIDVVDHMDLVRTYDIRRTPTVLVLDGHGRVVRRASGLPRRSDVLAALNEAV